MRFLLDVCAASRSMAQTLTDLGHDVLSALEVAPRASDQELLALALAEQRILVTEDKDFGELLCSNINAGCRIPASSGLPT